MSQFVLPPGFCHFTLSMRHSLVARPMLVTFAAEITATPYDQADADAVAGQVFLNADQFYDGEWQFVELVTLVGQDGDALRFVSAMGGVGTRAAVESPPPNVACLIAKNTGLSGRRNRGRMYWPCPNEAAVQQSGALTGAELILLQALATGLAATLSGTGATNLSQPVLLHSEAPTTPTPVTALQASPFVATQRRRLVRSG